MATATGQAEGASDMNTIWPREVHWDFEWFVAWLKGAYQDLSDSDYAEAVKRHDYLEAQDINGGGR